MDEIRSEIEELEYQILTYLKFKYPYSFIAKKWHTGFPPGKTLVITAAPNSGQIISVKIKETHAETFFINRKKSVKGFQKSSLNNEEVITDRFEFYDPRFPFDLYEKIDRVYKARTNQKTWLDDVCNGYLRNKKSDN
jgi:hypothetical protein